MIKKILPFLVLTIVYIFGIQAIFASHPFQDIPANSLLDTAVAELYKAHIISDDGSHKFDPNAPMNRDFYVSLATAIGCKQCLTPSQEDLIKYHQSPFIDLPKTNPFYYCIAYAADNEITKGYNIDPNIGTTSCENGNSFQSSPFCAENTTTRIEAAAMLLRRAKLWDENKNSSYFAKNEHFSDVPEYWYGYAQKAVEMGIIQKNSNNSVGPYEKITRGEFALMAAKILEYTQCAPNKIENTSSSYIEIINKDKNPTNTTVFTEGDPFTLIPKTEPGEWIYEWTLTPLSDPSGKKITGDTPTFDGRTIPPGKWHITVKIINPKNNTPISEPSITITVMPKKPNTDDNNDTDGDGTPNKDDKCPTIPGPKENHGCPYSHSNIGVKIIPQPSITYIGNPITFTPTVQGDNSENYTYSWDYGDGGRNYHAGITKHPYSNAGIYTVILTVTDPETGNTAQSTAIVRIIDDKDSDGDGVPDSEDKCPQVKGLKENSGCPTIDTPDYGCSIRGVYSGNNNCNHTSFDTDGDGTPNKDDKCPTIPGPKENHGCPLDTDNDTDGDGTPNKDDKCPTIPGPKENHGCPLDTDNDTDGDGTPNKDDKCPTIPGPKENHGCPLDTDNDGTPDAQDLCQKVHGLPEWKGCPYPELYDKISHNVCLLEKLNTQGLITGSPICNSCPCDNSVTIHSPIRDCDILFPSILSPDKKTIYSRGKFYLIQ